MDFTLSDQQVALKQSVQKFAQKELPDIARQIEESDEPPGIELRNRYANWAILALISTRNTVAQECPTSTP